MTMFRWYYDQEFKTSISGVVLANNLEEAIDEVKNYLQEHFGPKLGKMSFIRPKDFLDDKEVTFWVWSCSNDDDYCPNHPNCIAVNYIY